jgi:Uma2 family endonuclease
VALTAQEAASGMDDVLASLESPHRRRWTVEEYHQMAEAGILTEDDRVELIDGEVIQMSPIGPRHAASVATLTQRLLLALGERVVLFCQDPIYLRGDTEPQPDIALLRPPADRYWHHAPRADDVLLVVEVSDTSYSYDQRKLRVYARAGIPEVWIVDLGRSVIEVHREPSPRGYLSPAYVERGAIVTPLCFDGVTFAVDEFLPPA